MSSIRVTGVAALSALVAMVASGAVPASVGAAALKTQSGYYAANSRVASADVEFHVRANGTRTSDLVLVCYPADPAWTQGSYEAQVEVKAPVLKVTGGTLSFHGTAQVAPVDGKTVAKETFNLSLHRVSSPVLHFTNDLGEKTTEAAAWRGKATSKACHRAVNGGNVTLFGPIPGE